MSSPFPHSMVSEHLRVCVWPAPAGKPTEGGACPFRGPKFTRKGLWTNQVGASRVGHQCVGICESKSGSVQWHALPCSSPKPQAHELFLLSRQAGASGGAIAGAAADARADGPGPLESFIDPKPSCRSIFLLGGPSNVDTILIGGCHWGIIGEHPLLI